MVGNRKKLVIVGDGETAELAYDYFKADRYFAVVGFSAEANYRKNHKLFGLPVVPLEEVEKYFPPQSHSAFVAISYTQLNRLRRRLFDATKAKGYHLCSYISPRAYIAPDVKVGENCFILENVVVQRGARISDNVTIWSGSSVGHRSAIADNCFLASHVAISGFCQVGENSFLGVNCCLGDGVKVGKDCVLGAGAVIITDAADGSVYVGNPARSLPNKSTKGYVEGTEKI